MGPFRSDCAAQLLTTLIWLHLFTAPGAPGRRLPQHHAKSEDRFVAPEEIAAASHRFLFAPGRTVGRGGSQTRPYEAGLSVSVLPPLHNSDLFLSQPIHQRVDLHIGGLDLAVGCKRLLAAVRLLWALDHQIPGSRQ